jgi:hypothetical protein
MIEQQQQNKATKNEQEKYNNFYQKTPVRLAEASIDFSPNGTRQTVRSRRRAAQRKSRRRTFLFNLGASFDYLALIFYVAHAAHLIIVKSSADLPETLFAMATLVSVSLELPYSWSKFWLRIESFALIASYAAVTGIFLFTRITPGFR